MSRKLSDIQSLKTTISLKFLTEDGTLVMDRKSDPEYYFDRWSKEPNSFLKTSLDRDAKECGVQIVRIERRGPLEFVGIVRWFSKKAR